MREEKRREEESEVRNSWRDKGEEKEGWEDRKKRRVRVSRGERRVVDGNQRWVREDGEEGMLGVGESREDMRKRKMNKKV